MDAEDVIRGGGQVTDKASQGRRNRNRGNAYERDVARRLGVARVGQYGTKADVGDRDEWIVAQTKVGKAYPERLDGWLRAIPSSAGQLRALVIGDAPGHGHARREMIVMDFREFLLWYGPVSEETEQ